MEEKDLLELEGALRAATPAPWTTRLIDTGTRHLRTLLVAGDLKLCGMDELDDTYFCEDDFAAIAALRNHASGLLSDSRALLEARKLLGQMRTGYCRETCPGRWDGDTWVPYVHEAICQDVAAFLGEQNGKG